VVALDAAVVLSQPAVPETTRPGSESQDTDDADNDGSESYRKAVDEAVREFAAGRFEEARALFKRAHEISPNARTLRGLGMTAFELRFYVLATRELTAALVDKRKPLGGNLRAQAQALLERARSFTGTIRLEVQPAKATVLIDGRPIERESDGSILLDPGTHVVAATAEGFKSTNLRVVVESSTDQTVRVAMESLAVTKAAIAPIDAERLAAQSPDDGKDTPTPAPKAAPAEQPSSLAPYAYATLIGAGVFGAGAAIFWLVGDSQYGDLEELCAASCTDRQVEDSGVESSDLLTNVFLGLGAASAVASVILFAVDASSESARAGDRHQARAAKSPALQLQLAPNAASLRGSF
jgi:hypothetical protein